MPPVKERAVKIYQRNPRITLRGRPVGKGAKFGARQPKEETKEGEHARPIGEI